MSLLSHFKVPILLGRWWNRAKAVATTNDILSATSQQIRFKATEPICKNIEPKCGDRFKLKPCDLKQIKSKPKKSSLEPLPPQKRLIKLKRSDICCGDPCVGFYPRFDKLYYKRTDKLNQKYSQTWAECPDVIKKPKVICCFDKVKYPKTKKRSKKARQLACEQVCNTSVSKCPRIKAPSCLVGRMPPNCHRFKHRSDCKKPKAPFPAFSECSRKSPKQKHPIECRCLLTPAMCEVWSHYYKMSRIKKVGLC